MMLFDLFDVIVIVASIFYYIVMGFGFVRNVNKSREYPFSPIHLVVVALWPVFMFIMSLFDFFEGE